MRRLLAGLFILVINLPLWVQANQSYGRKDVAVMVLIDLSASMPKHRSKLAKLAPLVREAMQRSRCDFKVAVAGIHYADKPKVSMKPWGKPAWITKQTENGAEVTARRILDPIGTIFGDDPGQGQEDPIPNGNQERTYSSAVHSIAANIDDLRAVDVVSTLIVTDSVPGFESYEPKQAASEIRRLLGTTTYISGVIGPKLTASMVAPEHFATDGSPLCSPDFQGHQEPGQPLNTGSWHTKDLEAIAKFNREAGGWLWDVCQSDYDSSLRDYLAMLMDAAQCQLMM